MRAGELYPRLHIRKVGIRKRPSGPWYRNLKKPRLPDEVHDKEAYHLFRTQMDKESSAGN